MSPRLDVDWLRRSAEWDESRERLRGVRAWLPLQRTLTGPQAPPMPPPRELLSVRPGRAGVPLARIDVVVWKSGSAGGSAPSRDYQRSGSQPAISRPAWISQETPDEREPPANRRGLVPIGRVSTRERSRRDGDDPLSDDPLASNPLSIRPLGVKLTCFHSGRRYRPAATHPERPEGPGPMTARQPALRHGANARIDEEATDGVSKARRRRSRRRHRDLQDMLRPPGIDGPRRSAPARAASSATARSPRSSPGVRRCLATAGTSTSWPSCAGAAPWNCSAPDHAGPSGSASSAWRVSVTSTDRSDCA